MSKKGRQKSDSPNNLTKTLSKKKSYNQEKSISTSEKFYALKYFDIPQKYCKIIIYFLLVFTIIFLFTINFSKRESQYKYWLAHKNIYFSSHYPSMATVDAYSYLKLAKSIESNNGSSFLFTYLYSKSGYKPPLLSLLLNYFNKFFDNDGYNQIYVGSIKLVNIMAAFSLIPIILIFYFMGYPGVGFFTALFTSFSPIYYGRTSTGRVDTDCLILFFPFLAILLSILIQKVDKLLLKILIASFLGFTLNLYTLWHPKGTIYLGVYTFIFIVYLFLHKEQIKNILLIALIMILFTNPFNYIEILNKFLFFKQQYLIAFFSPTDLFAQTLLRLPRVKQIITELNLSNYAIIKSIVKESYIFWVGAFSGTIFFIKNFKTMLLFSPLLILGISSFFIGIRFSIFIVPFIALGVGYIFEIVAAYTIKFSRLQLNDCSKKLYIYLITVILSSFAFFSFLKNETVYNYIPKYKIEPGEIESIHKLKGVIPENSLIFSWFENGYAIQDILNTNTFISPDLDPGSKGSDFMFYLLSSILTSNNQKLIAQMTKSISYYGVDKLFEIFNSSMTIDEFLKKSEIKNQAVKNRNIYIFYNLAMIKKFESISKLGNWNFTRNVSITDSPNFLKCTEFSNNFLKCGDIEINVKDGQIIRNQTGGAYLSKIAFSKDFKLEKIIDFKNDGNLCLTLIFEKNRITDVILSTRVFFDSNINQQFVLGNFDKELFEPIYRNGLYMAVFEVK